MSPKRWIPVGCLFLVCALLAAISLGMPQGNASAAASAAPAPSRAVKVSSASVPSPTASGEEVPLSTPVEGELRGLWVTYFELADLFTAPEGFAAAFDTLLERAAGQQITALFVHVRSHCDAYYESALFPWSKYCTGILGTQGVSPGFDPLAVMIEATHKRGMAFHAWINPYRVLFESQDPALLADNNPVKGWLTDDDPANDTYVRAAADGLYLNPAVPAVQTLVVAGVKEIVTRYAVDGVHFDDYFYPTQEETFDEREYAAYRAAVWDDPLPLDDWRRANVTALIARVQEEVHTARPGCVFGISPMAGVAGNVQKVYADVGGWLTAGVVDYLMPQLYFGFDYEMESYRYDALLAEWSALAADTGVPLYAGLGAYRIGSTEPLHEEWDQRHDILARQVVALRQAGWRGFCLYSYSALFVDDDTHQAEREALARQLTP